MRHGLAALLLLSIAAAPAAASPRIVNGVETAGYPTTGALVYATSGRPVTQRNASLRCSGVLIGCRTFLTAAHCVGSHPPAGTYAVYLQHAGFLPVAEIRVHPDYDGDSPEHDLAIVKLVEPVEGIEPSAINASHDLESLGDDLEGTIVGFGRPGGDYYDYQYEYGIKRSGHIRTKSCDTVLTGGLGDDAMICYDFLEPLGEPGENSSTCYGDSGGPLFLDFEGSVEVAGVTYGGTADDCLAPSHSLDVGVFRHAAWIAEQLDGDSTEMCGSGAPIGTPLAPVLSESGWVGQSARTRSFRIPLRDDTTRVLATLNGSDDGDFDADLFVKVNADASATSFDCAAVGGSLFGACELLSPGQGFLSVVVADRESAGRFQLTVVENNEEAAVCGNGSLELGEQCDTGALGSCPVGPCAEDCTCPDAVCGNGILEDGERCDDGNLIDSDACDAVCVPVTPDHCEDAPVLELSPGSRTLRGDTTGLDHSYVGCGGKAGDAWYRFSIDAPAILAAATDGGFDSVLSLYRGDCDGYFRMSCSSDDGPAAGSEISGERLEPGQYILIVDGRGLFEGPFELTISLVVPGCGNDVRESPEWCDGLDARYCDSGVCGDDCECAPPSCGNDVRETGETCDGGDLGFCQAGPCEPDCSCPEAVCGNGHMEDFEDCDGFDDFYCDPGTCADDCTCDYGVCGNDVREAWESCDGSDLGFCQDGPCESCHCPDPVCGNGVRESGEACDGPELGNCGDGPCAGDCTCPPPVCGNGAWQYPEECDGSELGYCAVGPCLDCECPAPVCGNDVRESGEECDGEDSYCYTGPCGNDCQCPAPVCGNGIPEYDEECDGPNPDYCWVGTCQQDCTCPEPVCGNGILEATEECDAPDLSGCRRGPCDENCKCPPAVCGNDVWEGDEECDGPQLGYCAAGPCGNDCTCPDPVCGNGVHEYGEECDGPQIAGCSTGSCEDDCTCSPAVCGDGKLDYPEECDGDILSYCATGPCQQDCKCPAPVCGNNVVEQGENCDGTKPGYCPVGPCDGDCTCPAPVCGNNVLEQGENCDGTKLGTCFRGPCDPDCTCPAPVCGDDYWEPPAEECDGEDPGDCDFGVCQQDCTCPLPVCGDGVVEGDEDCDGTADYYCYGACGDNCECLPYCGDYEVSGDEECDGYFDPSCSSGLCNDNCTCVEPVCGDSIVQGDEECDGGNLGDCPLGPCQDNCRCPKPTCGNGVIEARESCEESEEFVCGGKPCNADCSCDGGLACQNATQLPAVLDDYDFDSTTIGATSDSVGCGGDAGERWYRFHVGRYSVLETSTDGGYDSYLSLFAGDCGSLALVDCNDDRSGSFGSLVGPVVLKPGDYLLVVDGHGSDEGDFTLEVDLDPWICCDADESGAVTASDALRVLRKGVGLPQDCPITRCDTTGDREVSATDALLVLRTAVGVVLDLYCPSQL